MSTILDALKKSEQERKLNDIPTLDDMPPPEEKSLLPSFWWLIVLILIIAMLVLVAVYFGAQFANQAVDQEVSVVSDEQVIESDSDDQNGIDINVISWSEEPLKRFVIVNGKLFRESEFVRPGLKVEEIKPESVVLIERGKRIERGT